jgi:hypothetical protein
MLPVVRLRAVPAPISHRDVRYSTALAALLLAVVIINALAPAAGSGSTGFSRIGYDPEPWGQAPDAIAGSGQVIVPALPPQGMSVDFASYPSSAGVQAFCFELAAAYPGLVTVTEIGRSYERRAILSLRLAGGQGDPDSRPALQLDGQHHAREPIAQLAVLYTAWHLVSGYGTDPLATHLLDTRTIYIVPMVNPDGNEIYLDQYWGQRKNARPTDDDGDGKLDEDPHEGLVGPSAYQIYEAVFSPAWRDRHPVNPFVVGWRSGVRRWKAIGFFDEATGRFIPQLDNDGDGKTNEDPPGGVDLNRNYPAGWENCSSDPASQIYRGTAPWSEPETRAVRDLFTAHPNIRIAVSYHSGDDRLAPPGIPGDQLTADYELLELVGIKASELTEAYGFTGTRHQHGSPRADGETRAWTYELGILTWLVEAYCISQRADIYGDIAKGHWTEIDSGTAWAYYHTGLRFNPPPEGILDVCRRWLNYNLYTLALVPVPRPAQPEIDWTAGTIRIPVHNDGLVPVAVGARAWLEPGTSPPVSLGELELGELGASGMLTEWAVPHDLRLPPAGGPGAQPGTPKAGEILLCLELVSGGPSKQYPAPPLTCTWKWLLVGSVPALNTGFVGPPPGRFLDLGGAFGPGGWFADAERWDTEYYHMQMFLRPPDGAALRQ